jgi:hypothetical protein
MEESTKKAVDTNLPHGGESTTPKLVKEVPTNWEKVTALSTLIVALSTATALVVAWFQLSDQLRQSRTEKILVLTEKFEENSMKEMRKQLACNRLNSQMTPLTEENIPAELSSQLEFLDTVGLLLERNAIQKDDVWFMFADWIENYAADARIAMDAKRKKNPADSWDTHFWRMERTMRKLNPSHGEPDFISPEDLKHFYQEECGVATGPNVRNGIDPAFRNDVALLARSKFKR